MVLEDQGYHLVLVTLVVQEGLSFLMVLLNLVCLVSLMVLVVPVVLEILMDLVDQKVQENQVAQDFLIKKDDIQLK